MCVCEARTMIADTQLYQHEQKALIIRIIIQLISVLTEHSLIVVPLWESCLIDYSYTYGKRTFSFVVGVGFEPTIIPSIFHLPVT